MSQLWIDSFRLVWFGLLGAFTVVGDGGVELDLGPPQRRELLAVLLTSPNRPVSTDTIVDALWPDEPPARAKASIQSHISRLRHLLGRDRIVTRSSGYLIRVAADTFDVLDFLQSVQKGEKLAIRGSRRGALEVLSRGLSLWRGEPFWDFVYSDWARLEIARLDAVHQGAIRERFRLALALGMHDEVLPDLTAAANLAPGDEALTRLHATALYRSGRQQDALTRLTALRRYLADELGLDPSPETDELELAILQHDLGSRRPWEVTVGGVPQGLSGPGLQEGETLAFDELADMELLAMTDLQSGSESVEEPLAHLDHRQSVPRLTNLPAQLTSFVGRTEEMDELETLVRGQRLVTVTGPAGVGKTRLALQVAGRLEGDLADGVWLVELAPHDSPEQIPVVVLEALGVNRGRAKADEFLLNVLDDRQSLLLVDNCEHLIDAAADLIESVLKRAPGVKVLSTSREPLGIPGEFLYPLAPLQVSVMPEWSGGDVLEARGDAFRLFVDRARSVSPLVPDEATAPLLIRICQQLDGLPLALELAAAQLSVLVERQLSGLESPYRTITTRQRTIVAAVEWSYRLLTPAEQAAFRRLAVFTGDFDRQAAQEACVFHPLTGEIAPILDQLVKRSLLTRLTNGRYRLLHVLRHAALNEFRQAREEEAATTAHARYYLSMAADALAHTRAMQQAEWIKRLDLDWPNIRTALLWALQHDPDRGAAAVVGLTDYFRVDHGWEGIEWTNHYLDAVDDTQTTLGLHRARALSAMIPSVHDVMVESAEYVLDHQAEGDDDFVIDALSVLAMKAVETSDSRLISEVKARMDAVGPQTPRALRRQANIEAFDCHLRGDLEGSCEWLRKNLDLIPQTGEVWGMMGPSANLADALRRLGRLDEALEVVDDAIAVGRELGSRVMLSFAMIMRSEILDGMGLKRDALDSALDGLGLAHRVSSRFETIAGAEVAAALLLGLGWVDEARAMHSFAHARAKEWDQESFLMQYSHYHDGLVAGLDGLSPARAEDATRRAVATPLLILINEIRMQIAGSA